jgi:hypothetical protein
MLNLENPLESFCSAAMWQFTKLPGFVLLNRRHLFLHGLLLVLVNLGLGHGGQFLKTHNMGLHFLII